MIRLIFGSSGNSLGVILDYQASRAEVRYHQLLFLCRGKFNRVYWFIRNSNWFLRIISIKGLKIIHSLRIKNILYYLRWGEFIAKRH